MKRFAILAIALSLAACSVASPAPTIPTVTAACKGSWEPACMKPYLAAAKADAGNGQATIGGTGASIATPSATYTPLAPQGFLGASRVTVVGDAP